MRLAKCGPNAKIEGSEQRQICMLESAVLTLHERWSIWHGAGGKQDWQLLNALQQLRKEKKATEPLAGRQLKAGSQKRSGPDQRLLKEEVAGLREEVLHLRSHSLKKQLNQKVAHSSIHPFMHPSTLLSFIVSLFHRCMDAPTHSCIDSLIR